MLADVAPAFTSEARGGCLEDQANVSGMVLDVGSIGQLIRCRPG